MCSLISRMRAMMRLLLLPVGPHRVGLLAQLGQLLGDRVAARGRAGVGLGLQRLLLDLELHDAPLHDVELGRHRVDLDAQAARRLVDEVDGLVRQEAGGDVAVREPRGGDEGAVLDAHAVVHLVALLQAAQDRDGRLDRGLAHHHGLEAPLQRGVLLHVLAVLVERRGAHRAQRAAGQHRLEQVRGVHRALGRAGADDRVQLVDEQDDLAGGVLDLLQHRLQAVLELAAVLGARQQRRRRRARRRACRRGPRGCRPRRSAGRGPRRSPSCRCPARRSGPGCSWCAATAPG